MTIALLGGIAIGVTIWFSASAQQIPVLVRYTTLRDEEIKKRMVELTDA